MLITPRNLGFAYVTGNVLTTRPAAAFGTSITPGNNSYGSYTEILSDASVTKDCYGILININSIGAATTAKDSLTTIGIDPTGGTSYTDFIPHLLSSCASTFAQGAGGHWYYFPLYIPAGTAIAAKGSVNNATVGTQRVAVWLYGAPLDPSSIIAGQGVEAIGAVTASSRGTTVTSGTTSEGSWTSLGATTKQCFAWQHGMGVNDSSMTSGGIYTTDIGVGDGTNINIIEQDKRYFISSASEDLSGVLTPEAYFPVASGQTIYGRMQCSGTADSALSMAAYGVY